LKNTGHLRKLTFSATFVHLYRGEELDFTLGGDEERCHHVAETATADTVSREPTIDFIYRVRGERRNKFRIVVRRQ
jgi:hypothetical protein